MQIQKKKKVGEKCVFVHSQMERGHKTVAHLKITDPFECKGNSMFASTTTLKAHLHDTEGNCVNRYFNIKAIFISRVYQWYI